MSAEIITIRYCWELTSGGVPSGPSYESIAQLFRESAAGANWGTFSAPRVVRGRGGACTWDVVASAMLTWPSDDEAIRRPVVDAALTTLYDKLEHARRDSASILGTYTFTLTHGPWQATINGPLAFWTSGDAANTRTRSNWDSLASTDPNENPVGPNDLVPVQDSALTSIGNLFKSITGAVVSNVLPILGGVAIVGGIGVALYYGPQIKSYIAARVGPNEPPVGYRRATEFYYEPPAGSSGYRRRA